MTQLTIDVGGTFTDCLVLDDAGQLQRFKASTTPNDPTEGFFAAVAKAAGHYRQSLEQFLGDVEQIVHGTTLGTNILITGRGAKVGMITTKNFRDVLEMRRGIRNLHGSMFDMFVEPYKSLVPRNLSLGVEERTLYTILAKPVPRYEYLIGKLTGVLLLLAISLLAMSALFFAVLFLREQMLINLTLRETAGLPPEQIQEALRILKASAFNASLLPGIVIIFLKASLLASLTLFISTFATSNIFTVVVMVFIYFIGHLQSTAREYWLQEHGGGWLVKTFLALVALAFPDLQLFNLVDDIVAGTVIPLALFAKTATIGFFYTGFYLLLAWTVFYRREL